MINHTKELLRETSDINTSLNALKNVFINLYKNEKTIYRQSKLTQYLKNIFENENNKIMICGTLSPCSVDIEHSRDTLE